MSGRVARHPIVYNHIDLPIGESPQYVDQDGFEVDAETFALAMGFTTQSEVVDEPVATEDQATEREEQEDVNGDQEEEVQEIVEDEPEEIAAPLLSLTDSLILPYSLTATRQRHMRHLLPHMFTHPLIPSHNRPRARGPPKGTFLFPTPPPPVAPLPAREYHGALKPIEPSRSTTPASVTIPGTPAGPSSPTVDSPSKEAGESTPKSEQKKVKRAKGKAKETTADKENEPPAHEIECIARITLSIGPISYPSTELWVGRFVEPRATIPKPAPRRKEPGEKRASVPRKYITADTTKRQKITHAPSGAPPGWTPLFTGQRFYPVPPNTSAHAGPSSLHSQIPPRPRPPPSTAPLRPVPPPRSEIPASLIQRVNQAATKHPWLSTIIHKAARNQASKDELAKLGRVVNRLKAGQDVGEGPDDVGPASNPITGAGIASTSSGPYSNPPLPSATMNFTARPPMPSGHLGPSQVPSPFSSAPLPPPAAATPIPVPDMPQQNETVEHDSDSDSDVDMKGPPQVGGGPPGGVDSLSADPPSPSPSTPLSEAPSPLPRLPPPPMTAVPSIPTQPMPPIPKTNSLLAPGLSRPPMPFANAAPYAPPPIPPSVPILPPPPPPPPRRRYPLPPPFLLIAFKDSPTEKFMIPLGMNSYISRVGDVKLGPATENRTAHTTPTPNPLSSDVQPEGNTQQQAPVPSTDGEKLNNAQPSAKSRTRASMTRQAKSQEARLPTPPPDHEADIATDKPRVIVKPRFDLPALPDSNPADGTVLISTFIPADKWETPKWEGYLDRLPFENTIFDVIIGPFGVIEHPTDVHDASNKINPKSVEQATDIKPPTSPRASRHAQPLKTSSKQEKAKPTLLNLAVENFLPAKGPLHPVTIRLTEVSDSAWGRIKSIMNYVEDNDIRDLAKREPHLWVADETPSDSVPTQPRPYAPPPIPSKLRQTYLDRKKAHFQNLLSRVPKRSFLRYRVSTPPTDLIEATTDKWAPRPYPISTKPLYARSPPPEDEEESNAVPIMLSPELTAKKGKKGDEPTVTFEMPVSLDKLDERVAESAMLLKGSKKKRGGRPGRVSTGSTADMAQDVVQKKRHGKRAVPGKICQGCGLEGLNVWRRGPGGKGTLCNQCGEKYLAGTLGELKAPAPDPETMEPDDEVDQSGPKEEVEEGVPEENQAGPSSESQKQVRDQPVLEKEDDSVQNGELQASAQVDSPSRKLTSYEVDEGETPGQGMTLPSGPGLPIKETNGVPTSLTESNISISEPGPAQAGGVGQDEFAKPEEASASKTVEVEDIEMA